MSKQNTLDDLMQIDCIVAVARWQDAVVGKAGAAAPVLQQQRGFGSDREAHQFMLSADAYGASVKGLAQINYEFREDFRRNVSPLDGIYIHGYKHSMVATWNKVAALVDNSIEIDIQAVIKELVLVGG